MEVIPIKISPSQRDNILTIEELAHDISQMDNEEAPCLDGFPYEFYKSYQKFISLDLYNIYLKALKCGTMGSIINRDNIKFIHKQGDLEIITNWIPITLLNVSYKIIAKDLALHL